MAVKEQGSSAESAGYSCDTAACKLPACQSLKCSTPDISSKVCNGIEANELGLHNKRDVAEFPWTTCYACPATPPTPELPVLAAASGDTRHTLPSNCSTAFFDPIGGSCLCTSTQCAFTEATRSIGNYSIPLGTSGSSTSKAASAERTAPSKQNSGASTVVALSLLGLVAVLVAVAAW